MSDGQGWFKAMTEAVADADSSDQLEHVRLQWLGKKGRLTAAMRNLGDLPAERRREEGKRLNTLREFFETLYRQHRQRIAAEEEDRVLRAEVLDMTLPGPEPMVGRLHPVSRVTRMVEDIFLKMGYSLAEGPEVETNWYNFEALNVPEYHPARAMQDSFFVNLPGYVLRTQTSPMQIRAMEKARGSLPLRVISTGRVYRRDEDSTHLPMFTQLEALVIDQAVGLADLKGTLLTMARELFGPRTQIRLRPSYFPFTEPSLEVDISCVVCQGQGCPVCQDGWLEILGSGMVHPTVLQNGGYDPELANGFALGLGIERVAMLLYGADDIRLLYQNDLSYLTTFGDLWPRGEEGEEISK